jgi:hypothetical protein
MIDAPRAAKVDIRVGVTHRSPFKQPDRLFDGLSSGPSDVTYLATDLLLAAFESEETLSAQLSGEAAERHAAAGHLTADRETLPLGKAAEGWSRCVKPLYRRAVLIP